MEPKPLRSEVLDAAVASALSDLALRPRVRFRHRFVRLILFGSRARGDARPDSDVDVAVVLRGPLANRWADKEAMIDDTYPILLATGLYLQPWPIAEESLLNPEIASNPELVRQIPIDGVAA